MYFIEYYVERSSKKGDNNKECNQQVDLLSVFEIFVSYLACANCKEAKE